MANHVLSQEKALKGNVLDEKEYSKTDKLISWIGMSICLWGVFFYTVVVLYLQTRGYMLDGFKF